MTTTINAMKFGSTVFGMLLVAHTAAAQFTQQGLKLVGTASGNASQGVSVALSADGNTAIVGGSNDNGNAGAAWIWTRTGVNWTQQGTKLFASDATGNASQGWSVALSADGNTAIVGGQGDNGSIGAAWVWTRSGITWTQQGTKLVGSGYVGTPLQGHSVALSGDGNTAIVGGPSDNSNIGAAWAWTRTGVVWSQQGTKLFASDATANASQGWSAALSGDGNTAIVGGPYDNSNGAGWIWTRTGVNWTQQGTKLVGSGATFAALRGSSVSLSAAGNTAIVGGPDDGINQSQGAVWVWTRTGVNWSQLGTKLVGSGWVGLGAYQGLSIALSGDGNTAIVGGPGDTSGVGAAWVFVASAPASATQLAFVQQPTTAVAGQSNTPAVTVQLHDAGGNPVAQAGVTIMISLSSGTGTLGGTLSQVTDASGLATFSNLWINLIGSKQLTAASAGLTSAVSTAFTITAAAAVNIVTTGGTSQSAPIGTQFGQPLQVMITDSFGNPVVGALVTYSAPGSGPSATLSSGGSATTDASGHASVTATANGVVGGPYLVSATTGTLEPGTFSLTNLQLQAAAAAQIPVLDGFGLALLAALLAAVAFNVLNRQ